jgi:hypothetical protein
MSIKSTFAKCKRCGLVLCLCAGPYLQGGDLPPAYAVSNVIASTSLGAGATGTAGLSQGSVLVTHDEVIGEARLGILQDRQRERAVGPTGPAGTGDQWIWRAVTGPKGPQG